MITVYTSDGRTLSFDPAEEVLLIGNFGYSTLTERLKPIVDVRPGNWLRLFGKQAMPEHDRDYDFVLVRAIAGRPLTSPPFIVPKREATRGRG